MPTRVYEITSAVGGSLDVIVDEKDIAIDGERGAVAHAAWRKLFSNEESKGRTRIILKGLCDSLGVSETKKRFTDGIEYRRA